MGEMRCPLCRRDDGFSMTPESIPEQYCDAFLRRVMDMQDSSMYDSGSGTESAAESAAETEVMEYSDGGLQPS